MKTAPYIAEKQRYIKNRFIGQIVYPRGFNLKKHNKIPAYTHHHINVLPMGRLHHCNTELTEIRSIANDNN